MQQVRQHTHTHTHTLFLKSRKLYFRRSLKTYIYDVELSHRLNYPVPVRELFSTSFKCHFCPGEFMTGCESVCLEKLCTYFILYTRRRGTQVAGILSFKIVCSIKYLYELINPKKTLHQTLNSCANIFSILKAVLGSFKLKSLL